MVWPGHLCDIQYR